MNRKQQYAKNCAEDSHDFAGVTLAIGDTYGDDVRGVDGH